jgi:hypothetical protein
MKLSVCIWKRKWTFHASGYPTRFALLKKLRCKLRYHFEIYRRQYRHDFHFAGTHNELSTHLLMDLMKKKE